MKKVNKCKGILRKKLIVDEYCIFNVISMQLKST
ncbi:MAG: hypothetical protein ACD_3C00106G0014 [uncultured bacterium (gcode 4)]|uniref:Uncharacterized protein n=1 Tax=uncultured bacterium (gcode 4) TaxID=1234023 RepID=K2GXE5_9BACT|nr:MAG: hypothetical protein ACD_3C00106G0014 [uncultured bacterium (gcode 4)]